MARAGGTAIAAVLVAGGAGMAAPAFASQGPGAARGPALAASREAPGAVVIPVTPPTGSGPNLTPRPAGAPATVIITGTGGGDGPGPK